MPNTNLDREDLNTVYFFTYASFAATPQEVADTHPHINSKYARQLLADLVDKGLVTISEGDDEGDVWQTLPSYDTMDENEAREKFDAAYPVTATHTSRNPDLKGSRTAVGDPCLCGCGEATGKSNYRPGHDARHAGQVGRDIAVNYALGKIYDRRDLLAALPSDALKAKAEGIAEKAIEKAEARLERERKQDAKDEAASVDPGNDGTENVEHGTIWVGKNEYTAVRYTASGEVNYFVGTETRVASKTAAKTFAV